MLKVGGGPEALSGGGGPGDDGGVGVVGSQSKI